MNTDPNETSATSVISLLDLAHATDHDGPAWSQSTDDLNVNLVVLRVGHAIAEHINNDVDVMLVGIEGNGRVTIDGAPSQLEAGDLVIVPKGAARSITPLDASFVYLTCHKRRAGLWPTASR